MVAILGKLIIKNGKILNRDNHFLNEDLLIEGKHISDIETFNSNRVTVEDVIDAEGLIVVPGFIDIHTHGAIGIDIVNSTFFQLNSLSEYYASRGVTSFLPTIGTVSKCKIMDSLQSIRDAMAKGTNGAEILGIHMEGPYISEDYRGAQNKDDIKIPDINKLKDFYEASGGNIKLVTIAPEIENAMHIIKYLTTIGVTTSIGHSGADYTKCMEAIDSGAKSITHFLNGMKLFHQHEPSIMGAALETDIYCEIICDGRHLHPGTIRMLLKAKGIDRLVMVTDSIMAAGLGDGVYQGFINIIVKDGDAKLESGSRAGSTLTAIDALRNLIEFSGRKLEDVVSMITANPAKLIGVYDRKGSIEAGKDADLVILDKYLNIKYTICGGRIVYSNI